VGVLKFQFFVIWVCVDLVIIWDCWSKNWFFCFLIDGYWITVIVIVQGCDLILFLFTLLTDLTCSVWNWVTWCVYCGSLF